MKNILTVGAIAGALLTGTLIGGTAQASTPKPLPAPFSWQHVPAKVAQENHISPKSVEILTNDTMRIINPSGSRCLSS